MERSLDWYIENLAIQIPTLQLSSPNKLQGKWCFLDCDRNEIVKHCWEEDHILSWDQKKVVDRES